MNSPSKGDEGSKNGVFEDPLCNFLEIRPHPRGFRYANESPRPCGRLDAFVPMGAAVRADAPRPHGRVVASARTQPVRADGN
jgi:hypothetical protein